MVSKKFTTLAVIPYLIFHASFAQVVENHQLQDRYRININRTAEPIIIDGELSEEVWQEAPMVTDFWMSFPVDNERADAAFQTEVRITYDDTNIYIGAVCKGPGPFIIPTLKRDSRTFWSGDAFAVVFDPVNKRTNGFSFGVNPGGVQNESLVTGQTGTRGSNNTSGINTAWDNKWNTNVKIYDDKWTAEMAIPFKSLRFGDKQIWGINFIRGEPKSNSFHTWSPVPVQLRSLDLGYTGALVWDEAPPKTKRNVSLIPYTLGSYYRDIQENQPKDIDARMGVDAKVAITSSLNLDLTINPDFSQVDVDEQVTNLNTFNVRFPERRLFFLENSDLFSDFGIPPMRPFFSRRIGLDEDGNTIPILYGMRLSGNLNQDLRLGVMNMQTKEVADVLAENYTSLTFHQRVLARSSVKGYFHNRQTRSNGEFLNDNYNRIGGLEFSYRSLDGRWQSFGGYGLSFSHGLKNENFFYNGAVGFDNRNISVYTNIAGVGDQYVADMGFIPRMQHYDAARDTTIVIGFHHVFTRMAYTIYPRQGSRIISHRLSARNVLDITTSHQLIGNDIQLEYETKFSNTGEFQFSANHETANLLFPFGFTEKEPLPAGKYQFNYLGVTYKSDRRKRLEVETGFEYGGFYNGTRVKYGLNLMYRVQPWGNFAINFEQNYLKFPHPYGTETLFLLGPKAEINFSRNLFWTTFLQYNTQEDNFNINSRFQWRFLPLSDIFLVYSDNYSVDIWGPKNRALVLKINYWLNI